MSEKITSRANPLMTHIRRLAASRAYRRETGEYLADGVKLLADERSTLPATKKATRCRCTCEQVWKRIFCAAIVKETFRKTVAL